LRNLRAVTSELPHRTTLVRLSPAGAIEDERLLPRIATGLAAW
jgi:hypothetical protein